MSKTKVFVNAWVGAGNLGDELLFGCLLRRLREFGVTDVTTISLNPPETERRFSVKALSPRDVAGSLREIRTSELLILGPGGILQDDTSPWSLPYQLHRVVMAKKVGVPVLGMGLGVGPIRRRSSRLLLRRILNDTGPLGVRDLESSELLSGLGLVQATPTADLVISSPIPDVSPVNRVVVCLRPHKRGGGWLPVTMQKDRPQQDYLGHMARALDVIAESLDTECRFVAFEPHRDHPLHERVASLMRTPTSLCVPELDTILVEVAQARAVVAMRFHSAIAALITQRPTVMIGYAPKVASLAGRLGDSFGYVRNDAEDFLALPHKLEEAMAVAPATIANHLEEFREAESGNAILLRDALAG